MAPDLRASLVLLARHYCFPAEHKQFHKRETSVKATLQLGWIRAKTGPSILRPEQNMNLVQIRKISKQSLVLADRSDCLSFPPPSPPLTARFHHPVFCD